MASTARAMQRRLSGAPPSDRLPFSLTSDGDLKRPRGFEITKTPVPIMDRNPDRVEAYIFNAGGNLELAVDLGSGDRIGNALPAAAFIDSGAVAAAAYAPSTFKSFVLIVDTQLTWVTAGQPTVQLIVGRGPWSPVNGAGSGAGGNSMNALKGAAANLGPAAATSLAPGIWPFSPVDLPDLQWQWAFVGLELKFPSALTAGAGRLVLAMPGGPPVLLGTDDGINPRTGDVANSFVLLPSATAFRITSRRAIWAATIAGTADLRVWESIAGLTGKGPERSPLAP